MTNREDNIPEKINRSKIILVEGNDDEKFFRHFLMYEGVNIDEIHFINTEGSFDKEFVNLLVKRPGFKNKIKLFVIIRDAETNVKSAFDDVVKKFKGVFLTFPNKPNSFANKEPIIGVYIIGNDSDIRILEDLCLKTVINNPEMKCVNTFCECVLKLKDKGPRNFSKAKAQAYLATRPNYAAHIGIGAKEGYWDFRSPELDDVRNFIKIFK